MHESIEANLTAGPDTQALHNKVKEGLTTSNNRNQGARGGTHHTRSGWVGSGQRAGFGDRDREVSSEIERAKIEPKASRVGSSSPTNPSTWLIP